MVSTMPIGPYHISKPVELHPLDLESIIKADSAAFGKVYCTKLLEPPDQMAAIKHKPLRCKYDIRAAIKQNFKSGTHYHSDCIHVYTGIGAVCQETHKVNVGYALEFRCKELDIMRRLEHINIVQLLSFFITINEDYEVLMTLVMEFVPETLNQVARQHRKHSDGYISCILVKFYVYQLLRGLVFLHSLDICHGNIKPKHILVNQDTGILKLAYFDHAQHLVPGQVNELLRCPLNYRAPELILGTKYYTTKIDMWSVGCVLAYLWMGGGHFFRGHSKIDVLGSIIEVLGTPTLQQIEEMKPGYLSTAEKDVFPQVETQPWDVVLGERPDRAFTSLITNLLVYTPSSRISAWVACLQPFFLELKDGYAELPWKYRRVLFSFHELGKDISAECNSYYYCLLGREDETNLADASSCHFSVDMNIDQF